MYQVLVVMSKTFNNWYNKSKQEKYFTCEGSTSCVSFCVQEGKKVMLTVKNRTLLARLKKENGFTLVELITVMVIITILVGIAVVVYSDVSRKPANEAHNANTRTLISAVHMAFSEYGNDCFGVEDDGDEFLIWGKEYDESANNGDGPGWQEYLQEWPVVPPESDYDGDYEVYLEYPGPEVIVKTTN